MRHIPAVFEAVRNEFGPELRLLHDGHHRVTPIQAVKPGQSLEPYDLFWLEHCTPAENQESPRLVRQHTTTPLAIDAKTNRVLRQSFTWSDGYLHPGDEPGLGVTLDADEAGKYPYERTPLPFNRLADGTVRDW